MKQFDVIILGAGQAGIPLAHRLASEKKRVAIIERKHLGGSCVNFGCTPTKAAIASARVAHMARRASEFGVSVPALRIDFPKVLARAQAIVETSEIGLSHGLQEAGVTVFNGVGRFTKRTSEGFSLTVAVQDLQAKDVVINTGARTNIPAIEGLTEVNYLHAGNWLRSPELPEHVIFAGAGRIALEMAQFYRRMGARVTVVGARQQIAGHEDSDIARLLQNILEEEGIVFHLNARVVGASVDRKTLCTRVEWPGGSGTIEGSHLFVATGRRPNTDDLGLDTIGLSTGSNGFVPVDERLSTRVPSIWVGGDARGGPMFTHTSWDDHRILASQLLGDRSGTTNGRIVPYAIFTDPELGRVGMTEIEARHEFGPRVRVATFEMRRNGKAIELRETRGMIKLVADTHERKLLGAAILSSGGAELVASCITLMNADATIDHICKGIYIHPTLSEALQSAASNFGFRNEPKETAPINSLMKSGSSTFS